MRKSKLAMIIICLLLPFSITIGEYPGKVETYPNGWVQMVFHHNGLDRDGNPENWIKFVIVSKVLHTGKIDSVGTRAWPSDTTEFQNPIYFLLPIDSMARSLGVYAYDKAKNKSSISWAPEVVRTMAPDVIPPAVPCGVTCAKAQ